MSETDPLGHATSYSYDAAGNLTAVSGPRGSFQYAYDNARNRISMTDGNGNKTKYVYDARKRLSETDYPNGTKTINSYDGPGNLDGWPIQAHVLGLSGAVQELKLRHMPWGLKRFHESKQTDFITFCCYRRRTLFRTDASKQIFEKALERIRRSFRLCVYGYVIMPEHVHLLLSEPERATLADALKSLQQGVSRRLIGDAEHFWQKRYYDFNIRNEPQFVEKLRYIHGNPVKKGLCERPEDWKWSSFVHYATGREECVEIESEWTARKRERAAGRLMSGGGTAPLKPTAGLNGPPAMLKSGS